MLKRKQLCWHTAAFMLLCPTSKAIVAIGFKLVLERIIKSCIFPVIKAKYLISVSGKQCVDFIDVVTDFNLRASYDFCEIPDPPI